MSQEPVSHLPDPQGEEIHEHRPLSQELRELAAAFHDRSVTLGEVLAITGRRAYNLILFFVCLPFVQPIPLPGLGVIIGIVVMYIGLRIMLGRKPKLPGRLGLVTLPPRFFPSLLMGIGKLIGFLEKWIRPRFEQLANHRLALVFNGLAIAICGMMLFPPIPFFIPLTNTLPALGVIFLAVGMLRRDGVCIIIGHVTTVCTVIYFYFIFRIVAKSFYVMADFIVSIWHTLVGWFASSHMWGGG